MPIVPGPADRVRPRPRIAALALACAVAACTGEPDGSSRAGEPAPRPLEQPAAPRAEELTRAAEGIVGFLRGEAGFGSIRVADTVTLYLSPEGGGARARVPREHLRLPGNWRVRSAEGRATYALAPPPGPARLTTRVGRHFNCLEYPLASRYPDLARLPHVGTKLEPPSGGSCLRTWNLTLVFDADERPPELVAVVYDQWEW